MQNSGDQTIPVTVVRVHTNPVPPTTTWSLNGGASVRPPPPAAPSIAERVSTGYHVDTLPPVITAPAAPITTSTTSTHCFVTPSSTAGRPQCAPSQDFAGPSCTSQTIPTQSWHHMGPQLGQHIRLLLEYTGTKYNDTYTNPKIWYSEKPKLEIDFPNLPYYIDDGIKMTQTNAIMRYIARKHDLLGKTDLEQTKCDIVQEFARDMRMDWTFLCYGNLIKDNFNLEKEKAKYLSNSLPMRLKQLSDFLGERDWLVGESIKYVDFMIYELLEINLILSKECLKDFESLQKFHDQVEALESIKAYMESDRFKKIPVNSSIAVLKFDDY